LCGVLAPFVAVKDCIFFAQSNDGVEVTKSTTFTPITAKVLNYNGKMRGLLTNIVLLGFMPPGVKNYQNMLLPVVEMYAKRAPSTGKPLQVHTHAHPARTHTLSDVYPTSRICSSDVSDMFIRLSDVYPTRRMHIRRVGYVTDCRTSIR